MVAGCSGVEEEEQDAAAYLEPARDLEPPNGVRLARNANVEYRQRANVHR